MKISTTLILLWALLQGVAGYDRMNPSPRFGFQRPMSNRFNVGGVGVPRNILQTLFTGGAGASLGSLASRLSGSLPRETESVPRQPGLQVKGLPPRGPGTKRSLTAQVSSVLAGQGESAPGISSVQVQRSSPWQSGTILRPSASGALARNADVDPGQPSVKGQGTFLKRPGAIRRTSTTGPSSTLTKGSGAIVGQSAAGAITPVKTMATPGQIPVQAQTLPLGRTDVVRGRVGPSPGPSPARPMTRAVMAPPPGTFPARPMTRAVMAPFPGIPPIRPRALQGPMGLLPRPMSLPPGAAKPYPPIVIRPRFPNSSQGNPLSQIIAQLRGLLPTSNIGPPPPMIFRLPSQMNIQPLLLSLLLDKLPDHQKEMGLLSLQPTFARPVPSTITIDTARDLDCVTMSELLNVNYHPFGCDDDLCPKGKKCRTVQGAGMCCPPSVTSLTILSHAPVQESVNPV